MSVHWGGGPLQLLSCFTPFCRALCFCIRAMVFRPLAARLQLLAFKGYSRLFPPDLKELFPLLHCWLHFFIIIIIIIKVLFHLPVKYLRCWQAVSSDVTIAKVFLFSLFIPKGGPDHKVEADITS